MAKKPLNLVTCDMLALYSGNTKEITKIIDKKGVNAKFIGFYTTPDGVQHEGSTSLLGGASLVADTKMVEHLLKVTDIEVNITNQDGETPLIAACTDFIHFEREDMPEGSTRILEKAKLNPAKFIKDRTTVAEMLIKKGANVRVVGTLRKQPIHYACENGFIDILNLLLDNGADINARIELDDMTPLHMACLQQPLYIDVIRTLLRRGADRTMQSRDGYTAQEHLVTSREIRGISVEELAQIDAALRLFDPGSPDYVPPQAPNPRGAEEVPPQAPNPRGAEEVHPRTHLTSTPPPLVALTPEELRCGHHCNADDCTELATHKCRCEKARYCGEDHRDADWQFHAYSCTDPSVFDVLAPILDGGKRKRYRKKTTRKKYKSKRKYSVRK